MYKSSVELPRHLICLFVTFKILEQILEKKIRAIFSEMDLEEET